MSLATVVAELRELRRQVDELGRRPADPSDAIRAEADALCAAMRGRRQ